MILLVTSPKVADICIEPLQKSSGEIIRVAAGLTDASAALKLNSFSAVIVDQSLMESNQIAADTLTKDAGGAILIFINVAINGVDRIVREVRAMLERCQLERLKATRNAEDALRNEINSAVAGILLSSELALAAPALPPGIQEKLRSVHLLAKQIRVRLEGNLLRS